MKFSFAIETNNPAELSAITKAFEILQVSLANGKETPKAVVADTPKAVVADTPKAVVDTPKAVVDTPKAVVDTPKAVVADTPKVSPRVTPKVTRKSNGDALQVWSVEDIGIDKDESNRWVLAPHTKLVNGGNVIEVDAKGIFLNGKPSSYNEIGIFLYGEKVTYPRMKIFTDLLALNPDWKGQLGE